MKMKDSVVKSTKQPFSRATDTRIGRRTGVDVIAGKTIRKRSNGKEIFDDYWTDSETDDSSYTRRNKNPPSSCSLPNNLQINTGHVSKATSPATRGKSPRSSLHIDKSKLDLMGKKESPSQQNSSPSLKELSINLGTRLSDDDETNSSQKKAKSPISRFLTANECYPKKNMIEEAVEEMEKSRKSTLGRIDTYAVKPYNENDTDNELQYDFSDSDSSSLTVRLIPTQEENYQKTTFRSSPDKVRLSPSKKNQRDLQEKLVSKKSTRSKIPIRQKAVNNSATEVTTCENQKLHKQQVPTATSPIRLVSPKVVMLSEKGNSRSKNQTASPIAELRKRNVSEVESNSVTNENQKKSKSKEIQKSSPIRLLFPQQSPKVVMPSEKGNSQSKNQTAETQIQKSSPIAESRKRNVSEVESNSVTNEKQKKSKSKEIQKSPPIAESRKRNVSEVESNSVTNEKKTKRSVDSAPFTGKPKKGQNSKNPKKPSQRKKGIRKSLQKRTGKILKVKISSSLLERKKLCLSLVRFDKANRVSNGSFKLNVSPALTENLKMNGVEEGRMLPKVQVLLNRNDVLLNGLKEDEDTNVLACSALFLGGNKSPLVCDNDRLTDPSVEVTLNGHKKKKKLLKQEPSSKTDVLSTCKPSTKEKRLQKKVRCEDKGTTKKTLNSSVIKPCHVPLVNFLSSSHVARDRNFKTSVLLKRVLSTGKREKESSKVISPKTNSKQSACQRSEHMVPVVVLENIFSGLTLSPTLIAKSKNRAASILQLS